MTLEEQQAIIDQVMVRMAARYGSSTRRDFEVAELVLRMLGSGPASHQCREPVSAQERERP